MAEMFSTGVRLINDLYRFQLVGLLVTLQLSRGYLATVTWLPCNCHVHILILHFIAFNKHE